MPEDPIRVDDRQLPASPSRQELVRRSRSERMAGILESITDAFIALDREWRLTYVNREAERLLRRNRDELMGRDIWELLPQPQGTDLYDRLQASMLGRSIAEFEDYYAPADFWLDVRAYPSREGLWVYFHDITDRKRAEETAYRLATIMESSEDAIIGKTVEGTILSWNPGAERLYGYRAEEIVGKSIGLLMPPERAGELEMITGKLLRGERIRTYETVRVRKDDRRLIVSVSISPIQDSSGRLIGAASIARDITARRRLEEKNKFLAQASDFLSSSLEYQQTLSRVAGLAVPRIADWCVIHVVDEDGLPRQVAAANAEPEKLGSLRYLAERYDPTQSDPLGVSEVLSTGEPRLLSDISGDPLQKLFPEEVTTGGPASAGPGSAVIVPLQAHGRIIGTISLVSTGLERRYDEEDLDLARELARRVAVAVENSRLYRRTREAVHLRNELFSTISHDLKNPLTTIKGMAQLLHRQAARMESEEGTRLAAGLENIDRTANRMTSLIDELLDVARLQLGQPLDLRRRSVDLVAMARQICDQQQQGTDRHHIRVETTVPQVIGYWDSERLERVLANLLSNAVKYSPDGGDILVSISTEEEADGRSWGVLRVRDWGLGVPAQDLPRIFDGFRRAGNVVGQIGGTGIGLSSARQIAEQHGGNIEAESEEGVGSTFTLRLPLTGEPKDAEE